MTARIAAGSQQLCDPLEGPAAPEAPQSPAQTPGSYLGAETTPQSLTGPSRAVFGAEEADTEPADAKTGHAERHERLQMNAPADPQEREWRALSDRQREIAAELMTRAERMWADADGEISLCEAIDLAAFQAGYQGPADAE